MHRLEVYSIGSFTPSGGKKMLSNMKSLVIFALVLAIVYGAPPRIQRQSNAQDVQVLRYETDNTGLGAYQYEFELSDGTKQQQQGELKNAGAKDESIAVKGSYSWVGPDGETYTVTYVADDNGYQPTVEKGSGVLGRVSAKDNKRRKQ